MNPYQTEDSIWIGEAAMARLAERLNVWCHEYLEMKSKRYGAWQITEFLTELMAITDIRLRLVRYKPTKGYEELDLSTLELAPIEGRCEDKTVEAWIRSGATLVANVNDVMVPTPAKRQPAKLAVDAPHAHSVL